MAILQVTAFSKCLMRNVPLTVVLPVDRMVASPRTEYPTLYLLHGIFGNTLDFLNGTRIGRWAMERELCVVMPSGENSFYLNDPDQFALWSDFVGKELVELTRRMFPLSHRREDTFLGGVSMGGYGALYNGLQFRDTFSWILALSAPIRLEDLRDRATDNAFILTNRRYAQRCFGDLQTAPERDVNPSTWWSGFGRRVRSFPKSIWPAGIGTSCCQARSGWPPCWRGWKSPTSLKFSPVPTNGTSGTKRCCAAWDCSPSAGIGKGNSKKSGAAS